MSSLIYDSCIYNVFRSAIHFDTDSFKIMLVSSIYKPRKDHTKRYQVRGEVPDGNGYIIGGEDVNVTIYNDIANSRLNISLGMAIWTNATIMANGAVYYRYSGIGPLHDDLVCYIQFNEEAKSINGSFKVTESTLRIQS